MAPIIGIARGLINLCESESARSAWIDNVHLHHDALDNVIPRGLLRGRMEESELAPCYALLGLEPGADAELAMSTGNASFFL
jgi:hypothetical protein